MPRPHTGPRGRRQWQYSAAAHPMHGRIKPRIFLALTLDAAADAATDHPVAASR